MNIVVDITKEDFWKFNKFAMFHVPKLKRMMFSALILIPLVCIAVLKIIDWNWVSSIFVGLGIGVLCDLFFVYRIKGKTMGMVKFNNGNGILGKRRIEIDDKALNETSEKTQEQYKWNEIYQLSRDKEHLYIFVNSMQAVIVPKRSFKDAAEEDAFVQATEKYTGKKFI